MNFHDWSDKLEYLKYFDFLKTDAAEAEILTGLTDRREAAKQLYAWGAKKSSSPTTAKCSSMTARTFFTCPVKARNLSGRTGRGDTTFGAYLAKRMTGSPDRGGSALRYRSGFPEDGSAGRSPHPRPTSRSISTNSTPDFI